MYMFLVSLSFRLTNVQTGCNILFFKFYNWPFNIVIIINNKNYFNNMLKMQNTFPQLERNGYSVTFLILHLIKPFMVGWRIPKKKKILFSIKNFSYLFFNTFQRFKKRVYLPKMIQLTKWIMFCVVDEGLKD